MMNSESEYGSCVTCKVCSGDDRWGELEPERGELRQKNEFRVLKAHAEALKWWRGSK